MKYPFDDPFLRDQIKRHQELQNNPAYQHAMKEIENRRNNPLYEQAMLDFQRRQNDPLYQYAIREIERRDNNPLYQELRKNRIDNYPDVLNSYPNLSEMQNLLDSSTNLNHQHILSQIENTKIDILLNKSRFLDQQSIEETLKKIEQTQTFYDNQINEQIDFKSDRINFSQEQEISSKENEYNSAELFILDLQKKLNDLEDEKAENEFFVMYVTFDSVMMEVKICEADSLNQIKFIGEMNGLETIAVVKTSDFNYLFIKHEQENSKPNQQIGFIIDREINDI